jgi:hypothetical protein
LLLYDPFEEYYTAKFTVFSLLYKIYKHCWAAKQTSGVL